MYKPKALFPVLKRRFPARCLALPCLMSSQLAVIVPDAIEKRGFQTRSGAEQGWVARLDILETCVPSDYRLVWPIVTSSMLP